MTGRTAARIAAGLSICVVLFEIAILLGAPWDFFRGEGGGGGAAGRGSWGGGGLSGGRPPAAPVGPRDSGTSALTKG